MPGWTAAPGAMAFGSQFVALTVQGTGRQAVVLESLDVRVVRSGAPLPWNDYAMGVSCGGGVPTELFDVHLDAAQASPVAVHGAAGLPVKSERE